MYISIEKKYPYDWFCGPGSHLIILFCIIDRIAHFNMQIVFFIIFFPSRKSDTVS